MKLPVTNFDVTTKDNQGNDAQKENNGCPVQTNLLPL